MEGWPGGSDASEIIWADAALLKAKKAGIVFDDARYGIKKAEEFDGETGDWDSEGIEWERFNWK